MPNFVIEAQIVALVDEIKAKFAAITTSLAGLVTPADLTTAIDAAKTEVTNDILNGAGAAYDTLSEIQALMEADDVETATIITNQSNRVAVDIAQAFTPAQQVQGLANLGMTESTADFVAQLNA